MGADFIIAVNISAEPEPQPSGSTLDMLLQTFSIMGQTINTYELRDADVVIRPELGAMRGSDFAGRNLAILAGERAVAQALPDIKARLRAKQGL